MTFFASELKGLNRLPVLFTEMGKWAQFGSLYTEHAHVSSDQELSQTEPKYRDPKQLYLIFHIPLGLRPLHHLIEKNMEPEVKLHVTIIQSISVSGHKPSLYRA